MTSEGSKKVFRRLPYYLLLVSVAIFIFVKGGAYVRQLRLGTAETPTGVLQLLMLLAMTAAAIVSMRVLLRTLPSHRRPGAQIGAQEAPPRTASNRLDAVIRRAFARRPLLARVLSAVLGIALAAIPFSLVALGHPGTFGLRDWVLVGMAEFPVAFVVIVVVIRIMSNRNHSH